MHRVPVYEESYAYTTHAVPALDRRRRLGVTTTASVLKSSFFPSSAAAAIFHATHAISSSVISDGAEHITPEFNKAEFTGE
ncbi:hypothetical protein H1R20_g13468, partial [Candolleomyces eurysporus]